jgi:DNA-binding CsgD family transcriptional regulator
MRTTTTLTSPLSQKQKTIWNLITRGHSTQTIADTLHTTRQFVNQTKLAAEAKLTTTLLDIAQANELQVTTIHPKQGILIGYHPALQRKAILTYTTKGGIKVWYWNDHPETVTDIQFLKQIQAYLLDLAKEQGLEVEGAEELHPAKLAHEVFCKLAPELKT